MAKMKFVEIDSPNQNSKPDTHIIMHYTVGNLKSTLSAFTKPGLSSHFVIPEHNPSLEELQIFNIKASPEVKPGFFPVIKMVEPTERAWHAGLGKYKWTDANSWSVGIEHVNPGNTPFNEVQIKTSISLVDYLCTEYRINPKNLIGHSDYAPDRKSDPGVLFPYKKFFEADKHCDDLKYSSFGLWHTLENPDPNKVEVIAEYKPQAPKGEGFVEDKESPQATNIKEFQENLAKLGYGIEPTGKFDIKTNYVVKAFSAHYYPELILNKMGFDNYWPHVEAPATNPIPSFAWDENSGKILGDLLDMQAAGL